MSWSRDQVSVLIELYKGKPSLYQVKNPQYKNKHLRTNAYESIEEDLKTYRPGTNVAEIKSKINGLRTNFLTEHRKYMKSMRSGAGEDAVYIPSLWYYDDMQFILEHVAVRNSIDSIGEMSENATGEDYFQSEENADEASPVCYDEEINQMYAGDENITITFENEEENYSDRSATPVVVTPRSTNKVNSCSLAPLKKRKRNDDDFLNAAGQAMNQIATAIGENKKRSDTEKSVNTDHIQVFGDFVVSRLRMIQNEELITEAEQKITNILFDIYRQSK